MSEQTVPLWQVDAFTAVPFAGNPAAVCLLPGPADAAWMAAVAAEMNLSETAFLWPLADGYSLRWFTPSVEVDLCGHATLASAHVLFSKGLLGANDTAVFHTRSGPLSARLEDSFIELDFPARPAVPTAVPDDLLPALGLISAEVLYSGKGGGDYLLILDDEQRVRSLRPDFAALAHLPIRGVIASSAADSSEFDFVSRFFAPGSGIDEDPVTGSAHCCLAPYWAAQLGKDDFTAYQASPRGGVLQVRLEGERVKLRGQAVTVLEGNLIV
jgi:PhzF family phenazine biosynthesis protein